MFKMLKRKNYFISPSLQIRYILMSVLPALIIGVYATLFLFKTSELLLSKEEGMLSSELSSHICILSMATSSAPSLEIKREKVKFLEDLFLIQNGSKRRYLDNLRYLDQLKVTLILGEFLIFLCVGVLALVYSHRIAGPIFRIKRYIEMLSEGKDIPPVKIRYYDEFKEVAELLEKLRKNLKDKK